MVHMNITQQGNLILLNCTKMTNGEKFRLVLNRTTLELIERPEYPDIDASAAYSHICGLLRQGESIPGESWAAWG